MLLMYHMFFRLPYLAEFSVLGSKFCMYILELLLVNLLSLSIHFSA